MSIAKWVSAVVTVAALLAPAVAQAQHPCEHTYRSTLRACERDYAHRCNEARHEARRICSYRHGHRCEDARRIAHDSCTTHSGCRREAEHNYRMCRRDHRHDRHDRPYYR